MSDLEQDEGFRRASIARWRQQNREEEVPDRLGAIEERLSLAEQNLDAIEARLSVAEQNLEEFRRKVDEVIALLENQKDFEAFFRKAAEVIAFREKEVP